MKRFFRLFFLSFIGLSLFSCSGDGDDDISGGESKPLTVSRPVVSSITSSSALVSATATGSGITSRGFCYSKTANPTIKDTKVTANSSNMTVTLAGLSESTTYHVRAYAQNSKDVVYSDDVSFTTEATQTSDLDSWKAPTYPDDYRNIADWSKRSQWNLANVHDPTVVKAEDGYYYMYQTDASYGNAHTQGGHFHCRRSADLVNWEYLGGTMAVAPEWVKTKLNEIRAKQGLDPIANPSYGYWAPCVRKVRNGLYRMYSQAPTNG